MFRRAVTLGHIAAIPVRIHWSWLIIVFLLTATLGPVYARYLSGIGAWALAAITALLICGSVLLHELSHALMAQRCAVTVCSITLFAFGGAAEVRDDSPTPGTEFAIAAAGPVISLLFAVICGGVWWALHSLPALPLQMAGLLALHLGIANAIMAVFNLLPGYPMDGGRVLRATLWFLGSDMLSATRLAARVGQVCGVFLGGVGVALAAVTARPLIALWMVPVGFFLYRIAGTGYRQFVLQTTLRRVRVADLMQRSFRTVSSELTLEQFVTRYVLGQSEQGFPVVSADSLGRTGTPGVVLVHDSILVGMMTPRDLWRFTMRDWPFTHVGEAMTPLRAVRTIPPSWSAADALNLMTELRADLLPVTDGVRLLGVLRRSDMAVYVRMKLQ